jgi:choloylglycine hydrolase
VVARTFDLYMSDHPELMVNPRGIEREGATGDHTVHWASQYGTVGVNSFGVAFSDGMNEKGLVANLLYLHGTQHEARDARPGLSNYLMAQYVLDNAATVQEALSLLDQVQIVSMSLAGREWPLHLSISDADGDSAVIEFVEGKKVVHHGKDVAVMTNEPTLEWQIGNLKKYKYFGGTEPLPGDIDPVSRFVRSSAYLNTLPALKTSEEAVSAALVLIKNVSVPFGAKDTSNGVPTEDNWPTRWTSVSDSTHKRFYYQPHGALQVAWIDLNRLHFKKGSPVKTISGDDTHLVGDVTSRLVNRPK